MKENKKLFPLDLQLFANDGLNDGGTNGGTNEIPPKTYSEDEYNKLLTEIEKQKREKDKYSKELADLKKKEKDKLTEEEKLIEEQKARDEELEKTRKELLTIKMSKELMNIGFDEKTINTILESFSKGDGVEFAKTLSTHINILIENVRKEEKTKFQQNSTTPPTGNNGGRINGLDPVVERYIQNKNTNTNKAREMLFGNNK